MSLLDLGNLFLQILDNSGYNGFSVRSRVCELVLIARKAWSNNSTARFGGVINLDDRVESLVRDLCSGGKRRPKLRPVVSRSHCGQKSVTEPHKSCLAP